MYSFPVYRENQGEPGSLALAEAIIYTPRVDDCRRRSPGILFSCTMFYGFRHTFQQFAN
jgi:hypothetical protein